MKRWIIGALIVGLLMTVVAAMRNWPRDILGALPTLNPVKVVGEPADSPYSLLIFFTGKPNDVERELDRLLLKNKEWTKSPVGTGEVTYDRERRGGYGLVRFVRAKTGYWATKWPKGATCLLVNYDRGLAQPLWKQAWADVDASQP